MISLAHGGLERLVVDWTNARNRRQPGSTWVVCLDEPGALAPQVEGGALLCASARRAVFPWDCRAVREIRRWLRGGAVGWSPAGVGVDLVHSHNVAARQYAALATVGSAVRHVHTEHGSNPHMKGAKNLLRNALFDVATDRVVAVSQATAAVLAAARRFRRKDVRVIPNGIAPRPRPPPEQVAEARRVLGIPSDAFVIGSVGRLAHVKGYDRLLRAFAGLCGRGDVGSAERTLRLVLVGDGPERGALEALAAELGVTDRVVFAGYRDDAEVLLELMRMFVLPSRSEGLPVALLEAMAAGCPTAATDAGETRRVLADGHRGWMLPDDETAWPDVLAGCIEDIGSGMAGTMIRQAEDMVRTTYSQEATLDAYEELYRSVSGRTWPCRFGRNR